MKNETASFSNTALADNETYAEALAEGIPAELSPDSDEAGALLNTLIEERKFFEGPAQWERDIFSRSPGHLVLTGTCCIFTPHELLNVPGRTVMIPLCAIDRVEPGDNFMMRGVVHVILKESAGNRARYTFFLGDTRNDFINRARQLLLTQNNAGETSAAEGLQVSNSQFSEISDNFFCGV